MRGVDHLHKSGRVMAQGQIPGTRQRSSPFYQKLRQHSGFVENVCLSMKKSMKCQCYTVYAYGSKGCDRPDQTL